MYLKIKFKINFYFDIITLEYFYIINCKFKFQHLQTELILNKFSYNNIYNNLIIHQNHINIQKYHSLNNFYLKVDIGNEK